MLRSVFAKTEDRDVAVAHVGELADHMEQIDEELGLSGRRLSGATDRRHSGWSNNQTATVSHALLSSSYAAPAAQFDASSSQVESSFFFFFSFSHSIVLLGLRPNGSFRTSSIHKTPGSGAGSGGGIAHSRASWSWPCT